MHIQSFETSPTDEFGDLLSSRAPDKELKVGFLAGAFFEYYRMWGEEYERQIHADMDLVAANLRKRFKHVVYPGLADTLDKFANAGRIFKEEDVDVVVMCQGTYCPDYMPIEALRQIKDTALILFSTQTEPNVDPDMDYPQVIRDSAIIGLSQLTGAFRKMGWFPNYRPVIGWLEDEASYELIEKYARAAIAHKNLQHKNIGVIGHVFRGMYDFEHDKTKVKGKLGPSCINIQVSHLVDTWEAVTGAEIDPIVTDVKKRFKIRDLQEDDLRKAARLAVAMRQIVERFNLDALCYLGQHHVEQKTQTTAYLGSALLQENNIMTISEGDVHGVTMMMLMHMMTGETPFFGEWGGFDYDQNAILIEMHGFADPRIAKDPNDIWVTSSPENWGYTGNGFSFEFTGRPGPVTIGHVIDDQKGYRMIISRGEILDLPSLRIREVNLRIKVDKPVKQYFTELLNHGFSHHTIVSYGDITEELSLVADLMGIGKVFL